MLGRQKRVWYTYITISVQLSTLFAMVTIGVTTTTQSCLITKKGAHWSARFSMYACHDLRVQDMFYVEMVRHEVQARVR